MIVEEIDVNKQPKRHNIAQPVECVKIVQRSGFFFYDLDHFSGNIFASNFWLAIQPPQIQPRPGQSRHMDMPILEEKKTWRVQKRIQILLHRSAAESKRCPSYPGLL